MDSSFRFRGGKAQDREEKWDEIGRTPGPRVTQAGRVRCWHGSAKRVGRVPRRIMPIPHKRAARASARIDFQGARARLSPRRNTVACRIENARQVTVWNTWPLTRVRGRAAVEHRGKDQVSQVAASGSHFPRERLLEREKKEKEERKRLFPTARIEGTRAFLPSFFPLEREKHEVVGCQ